MKRKKKRKRSVAHLKKYQFKKKRKKRTQHMAKKKKSKGRRSSSRKSTRRSRRRSSFGGGGGYALKPSGEQLKRWAVMGLYGYLEKASSTDNDHVLNKVPRPIDQLGFTGNTALILWGLSHVAKNRWLRLAADATAGIASYQFGYRGKLFDQSGERFKIAGWSDADVAQALEDHIQGAQVAGLDPYGPQQF